ncbi:MAG: ferritin family protein [Patescibacteria group bacterium]|nr:ferritin family protein [Patescibacteria group bacterium]
MKKTQENLLKAIAGESLARNKYTFFAKQARKEGLEWIARIFEETADNERAHAEEEHEQFESDVVEMTNTYDMPKMGTTLENLRHAAEGERHEWGKMYPDFKKVAEEEGEKEAANLFQEILEVEEKHDERYTKLADLLEAGKLYEQEEDIEWKCLNCGYIHKGTKAPDPCPLCKKAKEWYMGIGIVR